MSETAEQFLSRFGPGPSPSSSPALAGSPEAFLEAYKPPGQVPSPAPADGTPPAGNLSRTAKLPLMLGSAVVRGLATGAGMPGDVEGLVRAGGNALFPGTTVDESRMPPELFGLPTGEGLRRITTKLGLTGRPELAPAGALENYLDAGTAGLASAGPSMLLTGGAVVPQLLAGVAGGLAERGVHDLFPDAGTLPTLAASLVAGLGAAGAASKVSGVLARRTAERVAADTAAARAAAETRHLLAANAITDLRLAQKPEKRLLRSQTERDLAAAEGSARIQFETESAKHLADQAASEALASASIDTVASGLAPKISTLEEAGRVAQGEARTWISKVLPAKLETSWKPVNDLVPGDTAGELFGFAKALRSIDTSSGSLEPLATLLKPSIPARLRQVFEDVFETPAGTKGTPPSQVKSTILDEYGNPIVKEIPGKPGTPITWEDMQKLRTTLGDAMSNPQIIRDVGQQNLAQLYATLTSDMRAVAANRGALKPFDQANAESVRLYNLAEGPMAELVASAKATAEDKLPGAVAARLLAQGKLDSGHLSALRDEIPLGADALAAAAVRTGAYHSLEDSARAALVPDPNHRGLLTSAKSIADSVAGETASKVAAAKLAHDQAVASAREAARLARESGREAREVALEAAQRAKEEARRAALAAKVQAEAAAEAAKKLTAKPLVTGIDKARSMFVGGELGGALGILSHQFFPNAFGVHEAGAGGVLLGLAAPALAAAAGKAIASPAMQRGALAGVQGGRAALPEPLPNELFPAR